MDLIIKIIFLVVFFAVMIGIGIMTRKKANSVEGFVLGGRNAGPWLTAFGYGTSYFSAVVFIGYAGQFGWKYGVASTWIGIGNAVIGLPDKRLGEITGAIVEIEPGSNCTVEELEKFCTQLPRYKRPKQIILADVPRNATGKIEKPVLRKRYGAERLVEQENQS